MRKALGRGIDALLPELGEDYTELRVDLIKDNPYEPRKKIGEIDELISSIKENGLLEPIVVRRRENGYEIVCGGRRLNAAKKLGMKYIPAVIRDASDREMLELALVENLQREDLNPLESAEAFCTLSKEFGLSHRDIAKKIAKDRVTVTNTIRLLSLEEEIKGLIWKGRLSEGHARAILSLPPGKRRIKIAKRIAEIGLTVRETEKITKKKGSPYPRFEEILSHHTGSSVKITEGRKKGKIEIEFKGEEDLVRIVKILTSSFENV